MEKYVSAPLLDGILSAFNGGLPAAVENAPRMVPRVQQSLFETLPPYEFDFDSLESAQHSFDLVRILAYFVLILDVLILIPGVPLQALNYFKAQVMSWRGIDVERLYDLFAKGVNSGLHIMQLLATELWAFTMQFYWVLVDLV
eukprot:CAMPEP_0170495292 /NCGR_PEP_ID=MMETSP0208-20121228/15126_1 /TAXON_ID=197538 /ORGANISM="Strombidium inclinatum, Strain S3" /LENGTH=142 /DNA_ID=CAMNT_0010771461 /DNA_START=9 /DNA_END=437 /DNA_ORIENTATION=+